MFNQNQSMKRQLLIGSAALSTLCFVYVARLKERVVEFQPVMIEVSEPSTISLAESTANVQPDVSLDLIVLEEYRHKVTIRTLYPEKENRLSASQGTRFVFPANCFTYDDGSTVKSVVKLKITECYELPDILMSKLSTTADGRILETAGMVNIEATAGGKKVNISSGKTYLIEFPKRKKTEADYELFYGQIEEGGTINWKLAKRNKEESNTPEYDISRDNGDLGVDNSRGTEVDQQNGSAEYRSVLKDADGCFIQICSSYLRRGTRISEMDYFNWKLVNGQTLNQWFVSNFNPDLKMLDEFCVLGLRSEITFQVDSSGRFLTYYISKSSTPEYDRAIVSYLENMPALDLVVLMPAYTSDHSCILTFASQEGSIEEKFVGSFRKKYNNNPEEIVSNVDAATMDYFVFSSSELGWINCDRFYDDEVSLVNVEVSNESEQSATVSMVFDDIASIINGINSGPKIKFNEVPANKNFRLIAISNTGLTPMMATSTGNTSGGEVALSSYKPFKLADLEKQLRKM
jgi:hypothetical protein